MRIAHIKEVLALSIAWASTILWLWPGAAYARPLSSDMGSYDWTSLGYAAGLGFMGGILALIVSLAMDRRIVIEVVSEGLRNALVSPIAGMSAYLIFEAMTGLDWITAPSGVRFLMIVGSGWAGIAFFIWVRGISAQLANSFAQWIIKKG